MSFADNGNRFDLSCNSNFAADNEQFRTHIEQQQHAYQLIHYVIWILWIRKQSNNMLTK